MPRHLITILLAVLVTALAAPVAAAQDNRAEAVNTEDEALVFELAFDLHRTMDGVVDESNTAVAYASCERCRTIAVAFQIVLAMDAAAVVVPVNVAVAVNDECTACETLAFAYQLVLSGDDRVRLTGAGRARIMQIRKALRALRDSDASLDRILAELQRHAAELQDLLETELVPVGRPQPDPAPLESGPDPAPAESVEASPDPGDAAPDTGAAPPTAGEPPAAEPPAAEPPAVEAPSETVEPAPAPPEESPAPTAEPTPTATPEPTPEPTPTATPTASTDPAP